MTDPKNMTDDQWRGYVTAKLEDISCSLACVEKGVADLKTQYFGLRVKMATLSGTVALVTTVLTLLLTKHL